MVVPGLISARLVEEFPDEAVRAELMFFLPQAKRLDKLYIPTRYPNGLPDSIPAEVFTPEETQEAINMAKRLLDLAAEKMS